MIMRLAAATLASLGFAAAASAEQCYDVQADGSRVSPLNYPVSELGARPGLIPIPALSEGSMGVMCDRDSVVPLPDDFELVRFRRVPLLIRSGFGEEATILMLYFQPESENEDGTVNPPQYAAQLPQGSLSEEERAGIVAAIEGFAERETALEAYMVAQRESGENR